MAINATEAYLSVEQSFAKLVAEKIQVIERDLNSAITKLATPASFIEGFSYKANVLLSKKEKEVLDQDGQKLLLLHVIDGLTHIYQEQSWVVCVIDSPKWSSEPAERWYVRLFIKYIK